MIRPLRQTLPPEALDATDRRIINGLQDGFPLMPEPFAAVAADLSLTEDDLLARLRRLRDLGAITRFGPFFDAVAMGGAFCLCAMEVPAADFDRIAEIVNEHPEVAHNYARGHQLNMWFVLATETQDDIARVIDLIECDTGLRVLAFPKLHEFFIGFRVQA